jgi:hypothetical protein
MTPRLLEWTLEAIRKEPSDFSWMEEQRYDWVPLAKSALQRIVEGQAVLLLTDPKRRWFEHYILNAVNAPAKERPFLPVQSLQAIFPNLQAIDSTARIALLEDMLDIAYPQGYFFWYIGEGSHPYTKLVYRNEDNFLWLINEEVAGSFVLRDADPLLDIKLLQLYRLFDTSIAASLYGQVELGG